MLPQRRRERKDSERGIVCFYFEGEVSLKLNEWAMFQHTNEFNSVYFQTAFENKHIIKRCFGLQIYKAETRRSIERRYVRRSIEQPPALRLPAWTCRNISAACILSRCFSLTVKNRLLLFLCSSRRSSATPVQKLTSLSIFGREFRTKPKHRCCVEPPPSVAVLKCTSLYICDCEFFQYPVFGQFP